MSGSLTKESPIARMDATLQAVKRGMRYRDLLTLARQDPAMHKDAPGLLRNRYMKISGDGVIVYDRLLSLIRERGIHSDVIRRSMYFVFAFRDIRIRQFILEIVANEQGKWQYSELVKKSNASFFEQFLSTSSAKKARSNLEFLLDELGIINTTSKSIHLDISQDWIVAALEVAAQYEKDPVQRAKMVQSPTRFLIAKE